MIENQLLNYINNIVKRPFNEYSKKMYDHKQNYSDYVFINPSQDIKIFLYQNDKFLRSPSYSGEDYGGIEIVQKFIDLLRLQSPNFTCYQIPYKENRYSEETIAFYEKIFSGDIESQILAKEFCFIIPCF